MSTVTKKLSTGLSRLAPGTRSTSSQTITMTSSSTSPNTSRASSPQSPPPPETPVEEEKQPQEKVKKLPQKNPLSNFLEMFFTTSFFLCLCPFRLRPSKSSRSFHLQTFWPQRILCAILSLLSLFWFLREIRISVPSGRSPAGYVQLVLSLVTAFVELFILFSLWLNSQAFLRIVNFVSDHYTSAQWARRRCLLGITLIYTVMGFVLFFLIRGEDVNGGIIEDWNWDRWVHGLTYAGRYNFFVSSLPFPGLCNNTMRVYLDGAVANYMQSVDTFLVILTVLGSFWRHMLSAFCDFLVLMTVLTLWTATKQFCDKVKTGAKRDSQKGVAIAMTPPSTPKKEEVGDKDSMEKKRFDEEPDNGSSMSIEINPEVSAEWKEIYGGFLYLKKLCDLINKTLGIYVTGMIVEDVLYYAVFFDLVFAEKDASRDWGRRINLLFFVCSTCAILLLSADLSHRMGALKSWLMVEENRKNVPTDLMVLLLNQVDSKRISISGCRKFPITFQTLCAMMLVTATYFVLCVNDKHLVTEKLKC